MVLVVLAATLMAEYKLDGSHDASHRGNHLSPQSHITHKEQSEYMRWQHVLESAESTHSLAGGRSTSSVII